MKTKFLLLCLLAISPLCKADFLPVNLKVNGLVNPMGIDTPNPTFSWKQKVTSEVFFNRHTN